jgi:hypothetical protein
MWHINLLLSSDSINNDHFWATAWETRSLGKNMHANNRVTVGNEVFLHDPCRGVIIKEELVQS